MENYRIEEMTFSYPRIDEDGIEKAGKPVLKNISLSVNQGDFLVIAGPSGCGKTTLLRHLKPTFIPHGSRQGKIYFDGQDIDSVDEICQAENIGYVMQDVTASAVTDTVWHEIAFGLESLGYDNSYIRRRVAEMCSFFGLNNIFHSKISELSGGQRQMVNLASVMATEPKVLILDEPTSQLDPIAASDFFQSLSRINKELGTTVILTEHRLEEVLPICSRIVVMKNGVISYDGTPGGLISAVSGASDEFYDYLPGAARISIALDNTGKDCPVTVNEGRRWLKAYAEGKNPVLLREAEEESRPMEYDIVLQDVCFSYGSGERDVLHQMNMKIPANEIFAINGGNGSGKSTTLYVMAGINRPYRGKVKLNKNKKLLMLPQDPKTLFSRSTVRAELENGIYQRHKTEKTEKLKLQELSYIISLCRLEELLDRHPYDLSGGEQQRLGLALVLLGKPDIILLDEPTKGMDVTFKGYFSEVLKQLKADGKTILMVSHDIEFCAETADRCGLMFDGNITVAEKTGDFFRGNSFYTTSAARIAADIVEGAVTVEEVVEAFGVRLKKTGGNPPEKRAFDQVCLKADEMLHNEEKKQIKIKPFQGIVMALLSIIVVLGFVITVRQDNLTALLTGANITAEGVKYLIIYAVFIVAAAALMFMIYRLFLGRDEEIVLKSSGSRIVWLSVIIVFAVVPATIWFGSRILNDRKYYFISLLILLEAMLPFFISLEQRGRKTRDIVTLAVLCGLAVAGRAAFFMIPNFNPVMALVIISGVAYGAESGFIVGAASMLVSNMMFGQGPWTVWQMFSMGLLGFGAGILFSGHSRAGIGRISLCLYGGLAAIVIYGGIMNPASVIMWQPDVNIYMILAAYITGFPFDLIQALATVIFLWLAARQMLEKMDRIRIKYNVCVH